MRLPTLLAIMALAGCLSSPDPKPGGDGVDASVDAFVAEGMPFPGDFDMDIREVRVLDYNEDDIDDLAITNIPDVPTTDRGIFLLRGRQSDPDDLRYHVFVRTTVQPLDFLFVDIVGDAQAGLADLVVMGPISVGGQVRLEVHEQVAEGEFAATGEQSPDFNLMTFDINSPNLLAVAAINDGERNDIIAGDLDELLVFTYNFPANVGSTPPSILGRDGTAALMPFGSINGVHIRSTPSQATDDVVLVENQEVNWLRNDGSGGFGSGATMGNGGSFTLFTSVETTVDGDEDTVLGGNFGTLGGWRFTQGPTPGLTPLAWPVPDLPTEGFSDLLSGSLDGSAAPDVAIVDGDLGGPVRVRVFRNVTTTGDDLGPLTSDAQLAQNMQPASSTIADLDGDGINEIWAIRTNTGAAACFRYDGNVFGPCP